MKSPTYKAVLFDLDGTLIDSEYFYYINWVPILKEEFQLNITFDDWLEDFAGHTLVGNIAHLKDKYNVETTEEFMWNATRENYAKSDMTTIPLMPFVKELLDTLKRHHIKIALVTSSYRNTVDTVLGHHNLLDYFDFFVTREKVVNPKPNPEPYLLATEIMGLDKSEIVAIEDTITGYTAATQAGLECIAVSNHATERARLHQAKFLVNDLSSVEEIVLKVLSV